MSTAAELASYASSFPSFRNKIINGDMRIAQRGTAAVTTTEAFPVDRFTIGMSNNYFSAEQSTAVVPTGFTHSLKATVTTAVASVSSTEVYLLNHIIEGFNIADLGWGTSNAKLITLSFWVRSSVTGIYGGTLRPNVAADRRYAYEYTINSADTWEYKTIAIPGDTSGTWSTDNNAGIRLTFGLAIGSNRATTAGSWGTNANNALSSDNQVNWMETLSNTFYITGVQLEEGTVATPFEHRPYGTELALCQRYFQISPSYTYLPAANGNATSVETNFFLPTPMRATPTFSTSSGSYDTSIYHPDVRTIGTGTPFNINYATNSNIVRFNQGGFSGMTTLDQPCTFQSRKDILISAEL